MFGTWRYYCTDEECGHRWYEVDDYSTRDEPRACPECLRIDSVKRGMAAPAVMNVALPDGVRASRDDNYRKLREAQEIKKIVYDKNRKPEERKEAKKAADALLKI